MDTYITILSPLKVGTFIKFAVVPIFHFQNIAKKMFILAIAFKRYYVFIARLRFPLSFVNLKN